MVEKQGRHGRQPHVAKDRPKVGGRMQATRAKRRARTPKGEPMRVRALRIGYHEHKRRRVGDVFTITAEQFSESWMVQVHAKTPETTTTGNQQLRKDHDEIMAARSPGMVVDDEPDAAGDADPLGG